VLHQLGSSHTPCWPASCLHLGLCLAAVWSAPVQLACQVRTGGVSCLSVVVGRVKVDVRRVRCWMSWGYCRCCCGGFCVAAGYCKQGGERRVVGKHCAIGVLTASRLDAGPSHKVGRVVSAHVGQLLGWMLCERQSRVCSMRNVKCACELPMWQCTCASSLFGKQGVSCLPVRTCPVLFAAAPKDIANGCTIGCPWHR
jgi:hypothetical protein